MSEFVVSPSPETETKKQSLWLSLRGDAQFLQTVIRNDHKNYHMLKSVAATVFSLGGAGKVFEHIARHPSTEPEKILFYSFLAAGAACTLATGYSVVRFGLRENLFSDHHRPRL